LGFNCPPIFSLNGLAFFACVAALALPDRQSRAVGVGNILTASVSVVPAWCLLLGLLRPAVALHADFASPAVGVGSIFTAASRFGPPLPGRSLSSSPRCPSH
jgi:hypothetical protein